MFNTEPQIDEDATFNKLEAYYWESMMDDGHDKEYIIASIDNGDFWDWVDDFVPADELVYK